MQAAGFRSVGGWRIQSSVRDLGIVGRGYRRDRKGPGGKEMISKIFLLLDVGPVGTGIGLFAAVAFFLVCAVVAFAAFLLLKKTLKMAFRVGIVIVLLVIAVVGGIAFV